MKKVYLFNPENDIALGYGKNTFSLSPTVQALCRDGAVLPLWYCDRDDCIVASDVPSAWLDEMERMFSVKAVTGRDDMSGYKGAPWGWSHHSRKVLSGYGAEVPGIDRIERIRELSHRRISADVMTRLGREVDFELPPVPAEAVDVDAVKECLSRYGSIFVKSPWSSSGRGVIHVDAWSRSVEQRVGAMLRRQGSVMCEQALDKTRDFAMLFHAADGAVKWIGYSLFFNHEGAAYSGNVIADDDEIEQALVDSGADRAHLHALSSALGRVLTAIIGDDYEGYLGVDMMVTRSGMIAPCVEVNLRMTMGVVAWLWGRRFLAPGSVARYTVGPVGACNPVGNAVVSDSRLVEGALSLNPIGDNTIFSFRVEAYRGSELSQLIV